MIKPIQNLQVNWIDGMKLNVAHFEQTNAFINDSIRNAVSLFVNKTNFGILPPTANTDVSIEISSKTIGLRSIEITLSKLNALSSDGIYMLLDESITELFTLPVEEINSGKNLKFSVVVSFNPFKTIPHGEPDIEEIPLRHPFAKGGFRLSIINEVEVTAGMLGAHFLVIAQIVYQNNVLQVNHNYIPPCISIISHPTLIRYYEELGNIIDQISSNSIKLIDKITSREKVSEIGISVQKISEKLLMAISSISYYYKNALFQESPVYTVSTCTSVAHAFYHALYCLSTKDREELLKYFYEWKDVTPGNFEELLINAISSRYSQHNIFESFVPILGVYNILDAIWRKLTTLEFIGQRKENIVVAEQKVVSKTEERKTWTLLD